MIETSAHLIDHVIPPVPTIQWVLSFPWPLRFLYASHPNVLTRTLAVITRAIETDLIHRAGFTRQVGARSGIVTLVNLIVPTPNARQRAKRKRKHTTHTEPPLSAGWIIRNPFARFPSNSASL